MFTKTTLFLSPLCSHSISLCIFGFGLLFFVCLSLALFVCIPLSSSVCLSLSVFVYLSLSLYRALSVSGWILCHMTPPSRPVTRGLCASQTPTRARTPSTCHTVTFSSMPETSLSLACPARSRSSMTGLVRACLFDVQES